MKPAGVLSHDQFPNTAQNYLIQPPETGMLFPNISFGCEVCGIVTVVITISANVRIPLSVGTTSEAN